MTADELDEILRALTLIEFVAQGDYDIEDVTALLPPNSGPGSPYLTLLAIAGVTARNWATEIGEPIDEIISRLRQHALDGLADGDDR